MSTQQRLGARNICAGHQVADAWSQPCCNQALHFAGKEVQALGLKPATATSRASLRGRSRHLISRCRRERPQRRQARAAPNLVPAIPAAISAPICMPSLPSPRASRTMCSLSSSSFQLAVRVPSSRFGRRQSAGNLLLRDKRTGRQFAQVMIALGRVLNAFSCYFNAQR